MLKLSSRLDFAQSLQILDPNPALVLVQLSMTREMQSLAQYTNKASLQSGPLPVVALRLSCPLLAVFSSVAVMALRPVAAVLGKQPCDSLVAFLWMCGPVAVVWLCGPVALWQFCGILCLQQSCGCVALWQFCGLLAGLCLVLPQEVAALAVAVSREPQVGNLETAQSGNGGGDSNSQGDTDTYSTM